MIPSLLLVFFGVLLVVWGHRKTFPILFSLIIIGCRFRLIGPISLEEILLFLFFLKGIWDINKRKRRCPYPFLWSTLLSLASYYISSMYSSVSPHWPSTIAKGIQTFLLPYLFFYYVDSFKEIKRLMKFLLITAVFVFIIAIVSLIKEENLWLDMIRNFVDDAYGFDMSGDIRFGFNRVQSVFMQPVSYGYYCTTMFAFFLYFVFNHLKSLGINISAFFFLESSFIIGCMLSGSRSSLLPLFLLLIVYFFGKKISVRKSLFFIVLVLFLTLFLKDYINLLYSSISDNNNAQMGSSTDMRMTQLSIVLDAFQTSPWIGLGNYSIFESPLIGEDIMGAESVWFFLLVENGILGCIAYISIYLNCYSFSERGVKKMVLLFLMVQMAINTLTSLPGFNAGFMICIIMLINKVYVINNKETRYDIC